MKITKQIAENIANSLLEKKEKELNDKITKSKEKIREEYLKLIPKEVLTVYKKFPSYIQLTSSIGYNILGSHNEYFKTSIPCNSNKEELLRKTSVFELKLLLQDRNKLNELKNKTAESIYALKTSKNVEIMFPEAIPYLPKAGITNQIAINFKDLFNEIKDFPKQTVKETKEEKIAKVKAANKLEVEKRKVHEDNTAQVLEDGGF